ncbi:MAG: hypothetical protein IPN53_18465 [Comamonadaceae bacterium]|nr:hypothetical protein [Comamonadaceae bacterium]
MRADSSVRHIVRKVIFAKSKLANITATQKPAVIPTNAGIDAVLDSRIRGNDDGSRGPNLYRERQSQAELEYASYRQQQDLLPRPVDANFEPVAKYLLSFPRMRE